MFPRLFVAVVAVIAITVGLFELRSSTDGLRITRTKAGETPVTIFQPEAGGPAPVVVIAHGFAGSQQLMQPFAETLARNGYITVTFDFLGHGRNPVPMRGDITEGETNHIRAIAGVGSGRRHRAQAAKQRWAYRCTRPFDGVGHRGAVRTG